MAGWEAYDRLEPFGEQRADFRIGQLCSVVTNLFRTLWGEEGCEMSSVLDFMPEWGKDTSQKAKKQDQKQATKGIKQMFQLLAHRQEGQESKGRKKRKKGKKVNRGRTL